MNKYLLEIGVEELPYKFIPMAISQLETGFKNFLNSSNVNYNNIKVYIDPESKLNYLFSAASLRHDSRRRSAVRTE